MADLNFFSEKFTPSDQGVERFRALERYVSRQSRELYILLNRLERRLSALEEKIDHVATTSDQET